MIVLTEYQSSFASGDMVGFFSAGKSVRSFCRFAFFTFTKMWIFLEASTTPLRSVIISQIFSFFAESSNAFLLATSTAEDVITVSIIFRLFASIVEPVSVTSMMQSEFSGGLASVAPNDRKIFAREFSPFFHQGVMIMGSDSSKRFL